MEWTYGGSIDFLQFPLVLCPEIINFVPLKTYKT
jgi:hypothetical protein